MGNCLNLMSFHPALPSSFPSSSSPCISNDMKRLSATALRACPPKRRSSCIHAPFAPILPFSTPSNLGALYTLGAELGRGQFGIIRSCTNRSSGALFACKSISKLRLCTIHDIKDVVCEISIMEHLSNQTPPEGCRRGNVVRLHEVIEDASFVHLIMELCCGGELFDRIVKKKCYPEAQAAFLMKSILETLQFCHSMGIMHRDLKPENILLIDDSDASDIMIADFGLALQFSPGQKFSGMAGSAYYIAPEVLQGEYSEEIDMWSAGVIMYVLLSGVPPFWGETEQGIFNAIQEGELDFTSDPWHTISSSAKDLITQLLRVDVKLRWTPEQALKHPWIIHHTRTTTAGETSAASISSTDAQPKSEILVSCTSHIHTEPENEQKLDPIAPTALMNLMDSSMIESRKSKPELNMLLVALVANLDKDTLSISESLAKTKLQSGWTCTLLTVSATEETLMVDMGQDKYLIVHDRRGKRVGWKALKHRQFRRRDEKIASPRMLQKLQPVF